MCHVHLYCFYTEAVVYGKVQGFGTILDHKFQFSYSSLPKRIKNKICQTKQRLSPEHLAPLKARWRCDKCNKYGQWSCNNDFNVHWNSTLNAQIVLLLKNLQITSTEKSSDHSNLPVRKDGKSSCTVTFCMAHICSTKTKQNPWPLAHL